MGKIHKAKPANTFTVPSSALDAYLASLFASSVREQIPYSVDVANHTSLVLSHHHPFVLPANARLQILSS
jgi:hypothetical protein